jgi:hypothetical protein
LESSCVCVGDAGDDLPVVGGTLVHVEGFDAVARNDPGLGTLGDPDDIASMRGISLATGDVLQCD